MISSYWAWCSTLFAIIWCLICCLAWFYFDVNSTEYKNWCPTPTRHCSHAILIPNPSQYEIHCTILMKPAIINWDMLYCLGTIVYVMYFLFLVKSLHNPLLITVLLWKMSMLHVWSKLPRNILRGVQDSNWGFAKEKFVLLAPRSWG